MADNPDNPDDPDTTDTTNTADTTDATDTDDDLNVVTLDLTGQRIGWLASGRIRKTVEEHAETWDGPPEWVEARKNAAETALRMLHDPDCDGLGKETALTEIEPEKSIDGQPPETWWRNTVRPPLAEYANYNPATQRYEL